MGAAALIRVFILAQRWTIALEQTTSILQQYVLLQHYVNFPSLWQENQDTLILAQGLEV